MSAGRRETLEWETDDKMSHASGRTLALLRWLQEDVFVPGSVVSLVVRVPDSPGAELFYTVGEHILDARSALIAMTQSAVALERICMAHSGPTAEPGLQSTFTAPALWQ